MIKLISKKTSFKYNGQWYVANVPYDFDCNEIPQELEDIVEYYSEIGKKEHNPNIKNDGLLIKEEKKNKTPRKTKKKESKPKEKNEQQNVVDDLGIDLSSLV